MSDNGHAIVHPVAEAIGRQLRQLRESSNRTLAQVQGTTKLTQPYLSKIERGLMVPPPATLELIVNTGLGGSEELLAELLEQLKVVREELEFTKLAERVGYSPRVGVAAVALGRLDDAGLDRALKQLAIDDPALMTRLGDPSGASPA